MATIIGGILRQGARKPDGRLNVLTFPVHERYQSGLAAVNADFYLFRCPQVKDWNSVYAPLPANHFLLSGEVENQIPKHVDFDLVLSQNKFGNFQIAAQLAQLLHLPLLSLEHTLPYDNWPPEMLKQLKSMRGHVNVFISEYSRERWGWEENEADVIHHGVDTNLFRPPERSERDNVILSVVNDWINRDGPCGYNLWKEATKGLPVLPVGDTPGLSKPAANTAELVRFYQNCSIFINTSLVSPIPTALLEAAACGCGIVSTANCMIPEIFQHGKNALLGNSPEELADHCHTLLANPGLARKLGENARETVVKKFSLDKFVGSWDNILEKTANCVYEGWLP